MSPATHRSTDPGNAMTYRIRVKGRLGARWEAWFDGMTLVTAANGDTLLTGPVVDQAALHGVLAKVRDLGLPLLSIERLDPGPEQPER